MTRRKEITPTAILTIASTNLLITWKVISAPSCNTEPTSRRNPFTTDTIEAPQPNAANLHIYQIQKAARLCTFRRERYSTSRQIPKTHQGYAGGGGVILDGTRRPPDRHGDGVAAARGFLHHRRDVAPSVFLAGLARQMPHQLPHVGERRQRHHSWDDKRPGKWSRPVRTRRALTRHRSDRRT